MNCDSITFNKTIFWSQHTQQWICDHMWYISPFPSTELNILVYATAIKCKFPAKFPRFDALLYWLYEVAYLLLTYTMSFEYLCLLAGGPSFSRIFSSLSIICIDKKLNFFKRNSTIKTTFTLTNGRRLLLKQQLYYWLYNYKHSTTWKNGTQYVWWSENSLTDGGNVYPHQILAWVNKKGTVGKI